MPPVLEINEDAQVTFEHFAYIQVKEKYKTFKTYTNIGNTLINMNNEAPHFVALLLSLMVIKSVATFNIKCSLPDIKKWALANIQYYHIQLNNCFVEQYFELEHDNDMNYGLYGALAFSKYTKLIFEKDVSINPYSCYFLLQGEITRFILSSPMEEKLDFILSKRTSLFKEESTDTKLIKVLKSIPSSYMPNKVSNIEEFINGYYKALKEGK